MTYVERNGVVMAARDEHQLAAFLNNGWKLKEKKADAPKPEVKPEEPKYNKSAIMRMSTADLRTLAAKNGLENPEEMTGSELKEWLIDK